MGYKAAGVTEARQAMYGTKMAVRDPIATGERSSTEERARVAIESRLRRRLSEQEWTAYRSRLVAFFQLLRSWEKASMS